MFANCDGSNVSITVDYCGSSSSSLNKLLKQQNAVVVAVSLTLKCT